MGRRFRPQSHPGAASGHRLEGSARAIPSRGRCQHSPPAEEMTRPRQPMPSELRNSPQRLQRQPLRSSRLNDPRLLPQGAVTQPAAGSWVSVLQLRSTGANGPSIVFPMLARREIGATEYRESKANDRKQPLQFFVVLGGSPQIIQSEPADQLMCRRRLAVLRPQFPQSFSFSASRN